MRGKKLLMGLGAFVVCASMLFALFMGLRMEIVIALARMQLGKPYVFGAAGPDEFDCSGLTQYCYGKVGISMDHYAQNIGYDERYARVESVDALRRGDIVCFDTVSDKDLSDHVGIYLGGGRFLHASSSQGMVVVSSLEGFYLENFSWGRRFTMPAFSKGKS